MRAASITDTHVKYICDTYASVQSTRQTARLASTEFRLQVTARNVSAVLKSAGVPMQKPCTGDGVKVDKNGYAMRYIGRGRHPRADGGGYVHIHVLVVEQALSRNLQPDECVHHRDLDRLNNTSSNLMVLSRQLHSRVHWILNQHIREAETKGVHLNGGALHAFSEEVHRKWIDPMLEVLKQADQESEPLQTV
jgi:hypothetical protein